MSELKGKKVLITGGASGIGRIMARLILEKNAEVIIWDIDQKNIDETLSELSGLEKISSYQVDVSDVEQIKTGAEKVKQECGVIDVLINNAGIVTGKYFYEHTGKEIIKTMEVNAQAPMIITKEFLPDMMDQNSGHICNISSSGGLISNPKMSVYAASKWSVLGWSESLRIEMNQLNKKINVTTVLPYYINTGMFDGVKSKIPILEPEPTAKKIVKAIEEDKTLTPIPGYVYRTARLGQALMPYPMFDWFAGKVLGIYKTMENFKGRKK